MLSLVRRATAAHDIARKIREKVLSGELLPGDKLPVERDLAVELGVSRSTIREAVRSLEQSGIVTVRKGPRGGIFVAKADGRPVSDSLGFILQLERVPLAELLEARAELECLLARFAAERATVDDLDEISNSIEEMKLSPLSMELFRTNNHRFHFAVARASRNRVWIMLIEAMRDLIDQSLDLLELDDVIWTRVIEHHGRVLEAISRRDGEAADAAMRAHMTLLEKDLIPYRGKDLLVRINYPDKKT